MASLTAPFIETQLVVTGTNYFLTIAETSDQNGITRIEIGPYYFDGAEGQKKYPESATNELVPAGWGPIHWVQESDGSSWLRFDGGKLVPSDGNRVFQFTSNFPPSNEGLAKLTVWRGTRSETFRLSVPDYNQKPPIRNSRRDSFGLGQVYQKWGCMPQVILCATIITAILLTLKK
jgi:hypothetical protein